jgi:cytochrome b involved in lipid metabolism
MDRIQVLTPLDESTTPFDFEGHKWELVTGWGDVILRDTEGKVDFVMERGTGSVLNLSLIVFAVQNKTPGVKYIMIPNAGKDAYLLQVKSPKETHTYTFKKRVSGALTVFTTGLKQLQDNCAHCHRLMPIVGLFRPVKWTEYSVRDLIAEFDYSFLKLRKTPIVLTSLQDNSGYTAIRDKTNAGCAVYIHRDLLPPPPMTKPEDIVLEYCIFPREDVEEGPVEPPYKVEVPENRIFTYASVREENAKGRELVIFEDNVIDVKKFLERHPGHADPIKDTQNREIGRWIYGGYSWRNKEHQHSDDAHGLLMKYSVGKLDMNFTKQLYEGVIEGKQLRDYPFTVSEQNGITDLHLHIKLKNPSIKYMPQLNDISLFGKYWAVTAPKLPRTRNFACAFSAAEALLTEYVRLVNSVDGKSDYTAPFPSLMDFKTEAIPLIVKATGNLSRYLADDENTTAQVCIGGPYVSCDRHFLGAGPRAHSGTQGNGGGVHGRHGVSAAARPGSVFDANECGEDRKDAE